MSSLYSFDWLHFSAETGQSLSFLGIGAFVLMVVLAATVILWEVPKKAMHAIIVACFGLCIFVSFLTSTLSVWHHHYR